MRKVLKQLLKSQEGTEYSIIGWDYRRPDVIQCKRCGQPYVKWQTADGSNQTGSVHESDQDDDELLPTI